MAEEVTKVVENVDKLFSEIVVNGESHVSDRYVPPEPAEVNLPSSQEGETPQEATPQEDVQGEYVDTLLLNSIRHDLKDTPLTQEVSAIQQAINILQGRLNDLVASVGNINSKIPVQASAQNQLADKNFVNSSIATNTANFLGTYSTLAEIEAIPNPTNNDYAFLETADGAGNNVYDRYKYSAEDGEWLFEYELNNSSFTAEQWATINSGITAVTDVVQSGNYNPVTSNAVKDAIDNSGSGIKVFDTEQEIIDDLPNLSPLDIVAYKASKDPKSGVPLGTWASFENDSAPNGEWLESGTTFDANTYPALAMMLGGNTVPDLYNHNKLSAYENASFSTTNKQAEYDGILVLTCTLSPDSNAIYINDTIITSGVRTHQSPHHFSLTVAFKKGDNIRYSTTGNIVYQKVAYYKHPMFIKATPTSSDSDYQGTLNAIRRYASINPDWANAQAITIDTTTPFEAPSDGWIVGYAQNNLSQTVASINGVEVAKSLSTSTYAYAMNLNIRVSKGDTMTISGNFYVQKLSFIPSKQGL